MKTFNILLERLSAAGQPISKTLLRYVFLSAACTISSLAYAEGSSDVFAGNVQFMSNYVGRGLSQSVGQPSVGAELDYNPNDGFYAGLSGYSIDVLDQLYPGDSASLLLEGAMGYRQSFAQDSQWKLSIQRVQFPGRYVPQAQPMEEPNTTEITGYLRWKRLSLKLNYAVTDYYGTFDSQGSWYVDCGAVLPMNGKWSFGAHLGRKMLAGSNPFSGLENSRRNYTDYKASVSYSLSSRISFTLANTWTNANPVLYTVNGYNVSGHQTWFLIEEDW